MLRHRMEQRSLLYTTNTPLSLQHGLHIRPNPRRFLQFLARRKGFFSHHGSLRQEFRRRAAKSVSIAKESLASWH
jgi:hypothetical protein